MNSYQDSLYTLCNISVFKFKTQCCFALTLSYIWDILRNDHACAKKSVSCQTTQASMFK